MSTHATTPASRPPSTTPLHRPIRSTLVTLLCTGIALPGFATTPLADQPLFSNTTVPGNVALALSVEYPTAIRTAHTNTTYETAVEYLGYFDPNKCYTYNVTTSDNDSYFIPAGTASSHRCTAKWSGNFLNWATMQTIDPFRWALTGGYRVRDEPALTVLERAWQSTQSATLAPNKSLDMALVPGATPFTGASNLRIRVSGLGNKFRFTTSAATDLNAATATPYAEADALASSGKGKNNSTTDNPVLFEAFARVKVCDPGPGTGGVEKNCKQYGQNWKPEGLIQQYADRMRFSAFGYMNQQDGNTRDGGVLRARQKFVGPTQPVSGMPAVDNPLKEWDPTTGVFTLNPDAADAATTNTVFAPSTNVTNSGVMNYLNKFGEITHGNYRSNDPVSELYYATLRYFRNLGNVPEWSNIAAGTSAATITARLDGFPVITTWDDPVQHACQRNFVLGIGDIYTHADKNVPGNTNATNEPAMPAAVSADTAVNAVTATNKVGVMQGIGASYGTATNVSSGCCSTNSGLMSGLAYWANTHDIRPDVDTVPKTKGKQTVQTYWVDVLEKPFVANNQFYLAAKYGGFSVPDDFDFNRTAALDKSWWATTGDQVGTQDRPDNYFTAGKPDLMVAGLNKVFLSIASQLRAYTTSFALPSPQVELLGSVSFSSQYDTSAWTGEVSGTTFTLDAATGQPTVSAAWKFSEKLAAQIAGTKWQSDRRVVTRNTETNSSVPFRADRLSQAQLAALNTAYRDGDDSGDYLNYLRGDRTYEASSTTAANRFYRTRATLVGDIVGSKARPVGPPSVMLSDTSNPGYNAFKTKYASRPTVVYVGANDGMMHAILGTKAESSTAVLGSELFAYVPGALYQGPTATPQINGLAALGNPSFLHHYYVNATPQVYDIDLNYTGASPTAPTADNSDWRSLLIGGLGKGGKSYYAIDVTDPASMSTEDAVASKVLWEFTDPDLGYTFGEPSVVKTRKYGWVVIFVSGYNNPDGRGYFFFVDPKTGKLLEKVSTGIGSPTESAGLAHVNTYVNRLSDGTADAAYAGDLLGNIWRVDLRPLSGGYASPTLLARVTDSDGAGQPVTSRPRVEIENARMLPTWAAKRFVLFGTGRLLADSDIGNTQNQAFYAIKDGTGDAFNVDTATLPIRRTKMAENDPLVGVKSTEADFTGWYINLGRGNHNYAWRVLSGPSIFASLDLAAFAALLPNGDACNPAGSSRVYAVNYGNGASVLTSGKSIVSNIELNSAVTDIQFVNQRTSTGATTPRLIVGTDQGETKSLPGNFTKGPTKRILNWRELKVAN